MHAMNRNGLLNPIHLTVNSNRFGLSPVAVPDPYAPGIYTRLPERAPKCIRSDQANQ